MCFRATETSKGLGLFIVSEVLDKIGGNISVQLEYGVQTEFHLVIPNKLIGNAYDIQLLRILLKLFRPTHIAILLCVYL